MRCERDREGRLCWSFQFEDIPTLAALSNETLPTMVYHYTDLAGADGILGTRVLWLSKITSLNDISEHVGLLEVLRRSLHDVADSSAELLRGFLLQAHSALATSWASNIFVFSLSAEYDSLGQWRAYGNNGNGVAIGFHTDELLRRISGFNGALRFVRCSYDPDTHRRIAGELVDLLCHCHALLVERGNPERQREEQLSFLEAFTTFLLQIAPIIKNPYFRDERECRIITSPLSWQEPDYKVELRDAELVERFELSFGDMNYTLVPEVIVGPHRDAQRTAYALWVYLQKRGYRETAVRCSDIPFRG